MRIISGKYKGRRFSPPADKWPTRPTTDFAKEALFNILNNLLDFEESSVLDLFGGTGSHCYEFISRGCTDVTYVDQLAPAVAFVKKTIESLGEANSIRIVQSDVFQFIHNSGASYDYIFAGPPYPLKNLDSIPDKIFAHKMLNEDGLFILEHNAQHDFSNHEHFSQMRKYGGTHFTFFE
ncbi:MAG: RsmD family RNA methyltransferase [Saprospiraceae bacterium]